MTENLIILDMIADSRISVEQALLLLEVLAEDERHGAPPSPPRVEINIHPNSEAGMVYANAEGA